MKEGRRCAYEGKSERTRVSVSEEGMGSVKGSISSGKDGRGLYERKIEAH